MDYSNSSPGELGKIRIRFNSETASRTPYEIETEFDTKTIISIMYGLSGAFSKEPRLAESFKHIITAISMPIAAKLGNMLAKSWPQGPPIGAMFGSGSGSGPGSISPEELTKFVSDLSKGQFSPEDIFKQDKAEAETETDPKDAKEK